MFAVERLVRYEPFYLNLFSLIVWCTIWRFCCKDKNTIRHIQINLTLVIFVILLGCVKLKHPTTIC